MEIFEKLGIDLSLFIQLGIFCVAYLILSRLVFKPYLKAFEKRESMTVGSDEVATKLNEETVVIEEEYKSAAKNLNSKIQKVFEAARSEATSEQTRKIIEARKEAEQRMTSALDEIKKEKTKASNEVSGEIAALSGAVVNKLLGRELR